MRRHRLHGGTRAARRMTPGFAGRSCGAARFRHAPRHGSARLMVAPLPCRLRRRSGPAGRGRFAPLVSKPWPVRSDGSPPTGLRETGRGTCLDLGESIKNKATSHVADPDSIRCGTVSRPMRDWLFPVRRVANRFWRSSIRSFGGFRLGGGLAFLAMPSARALRCNRRSLTLPAISAAIPIASGRWRSLRAPLASRAESPVLECRVRPGRANRPGESGAQHDRRTRRLMSYLSRCDFQAWQIRDSPRQGTAATGLLAAGFAWSLALPANRGCCAARTTRRLSGLDPGVAGICRTGGVPGGM